MAKLPEISLQEAIDSLSRRPGLVIGPGATSLPGILSKIFLDAFRPYGQSEIFKEIVNDSNYRAALDVLAENVPEDFISVKRTIRDGLLKLTASLDLPHLAKAGWSACISLSEDVLFESALSNFLDGKPSSVASTIIDHIAVNPPERTIPIYKLLGNINSVDDDRMLAITESDLLLRQQDWAELLRSFPDYLREAPLFFIGTEAVIPLVRALMSTLLAMPRPGVSRFLFLKDDKTLDDPTIKALCAKRSVSIIDASLRDFCAAIANLKPARPSLALLSTQPTKPDDIRKFISSYENLFSLVPVEKLDKSLVALHMPKLIDGLFRPAAIDWRPFLAGIDLRRTCTDDIKQKVEMLLGNPIAAPLHSLIVHGEAGIGKSLLLKRVAVELAETGATILWCKRATAGGYIRAYKDFAKALSEALKEKPQNDFRLVIVCDDPWTLRLDAGDILSCFDRFHGKVAFLFAVRNSDYFSNENSIAVNGVSRTIEYEIPFALDDEELHGIGEMLQRIGAVKDAAGADAELAKLSKRDAKDILCSLWSLVPETRSQLTESLRDEYCRLGNVKESIAGIAGDLSKASAIAHKAYEFVTVTSNFDIGLPIEVLVRALRVDYSEWLDMMVGGRPLWGLLYDEKELEDSTVLFRTRNRIITNVLLDLVNGGVGHAGEIRVLKQLLRSCDVGSAVYRSFVLDILVRARGKLEKILTYDEGLELFEIARNTLPHADRVIEHHRGIWMQDKGHDYKNAYAQFENALLCDLYPGAERNAPQEHIHTSMAATVVQMVKQGLQDKASGLDLVRSHLRQATSSTFFNSHTAHVSANLLFELAMQGNAFGEDINLSSLGEALQEIERAFQSIGAHVRGYSNHEKSLGMLLNLQRKILSAIPDIEKLKKLALRKFDESGNQIGFEVAARRMLIEANESGKGKDYNELNKYLVDLTDLIDSKGRELSLELLAVRVDLIIRWKIQRYGTVDWNAFKMDLDLLLKNVQYRDNVMKIFYHSVALFQCGHLTDANASFAGLRRLTAPSYTLSPREIRCYYINQNGDPKRFQCEIEKEHLLWYVKIPELNLTVPARAPGAVGGKGATVHAFIGFALNGPLAVFVRPNETDMLLP